MNITALERKIEEYRVLEEELVARMAEAATDTQRFEIERMRRLTQVAAFGLLSSAKKELARDHAGHGAGAAIRSQATA